MWQVREAFRELVFPRLCELCECRLAEGEQALCAGCQRRLNGQALDPSRWRTLLTPGHMLFRVTCWRFGRQGAIRELLHRVKYGRRRELGQQLGVELGKRLMREAKRFALEARYEPLLVPVPLHPARQRRRGYNQARVIASGVAGITGWSLLAPGKLTRVRQTGSQTGLNATGRRANLAGAFRRRELRLLPQELPVIIDDVHTTGATLMEMSDMLREAGADRLAAGTLAEA